MLGQVTLIRQERPVRDGQSIQVCDWIAVGVYFDRIICTVSNTGNFADIPIVIKSATEFLERHFSFSTHHKVHSRVLCYFAVV